MMGTDNAGPLYMTMFLPWCVRGVCMVFCTQVMLCSGAREEKGKGGRGTRPALASSQGKAAARYMAAARQCFSPRLEVVRICESKLRVRSSPLSLFLCVCVWGGGWGVGDLHLVSFWLLFPLCSPVTR